MRIFTVLSVFISYLFLSLSALADCPDANAVLCQSRTDLSMRKILSTKPYGTCWSFASGCKWCSGKEHEKNQECKQAFGETFEARMPITQ